MQPHDIHLDDNWVKYAEEVRLQLKRILRSSVFLSRKMPADILEFLVESTLADKEVSLDDILDRFYPANQAATVRNAASVNASYARSLLKVYYDTLGYDDPIIIEFPHLPEKAKRTPNYRPTFRFRADTQQQWISDQARHWMHSTNQPFGASLAFWYFHKLTGDIFAGFAGDPSVLSAPDPSHIEAYWGMAESASIRHICCYSEGIPAVVEQCAKRAADLKPGHWRTHLTAALCDMLRCQVKDAGLHFEKALSANRAEVSRSYWYHAFLFAIGEKPEFDSDFPKTTDANACTMFAFWLYGFRLQKEALKFFETAVLVAENCSLGELGLALTLFSSPEEARAQERALRYVERLQHVPRRIRWEVSDLLMFFAFKLLPPEERESYLIQANARLESAHPVVMPDDTFRYFPTFQSAARLVAEGQQDEAVKCLATMWYRHEPLRMWLHMMPIFDSLLDHPGFQVLLSHRLDPTRFSAGPASTSFTA